VDDQLDLFGAQPLPFAAHDAALAAARPPHLRLGTSSWTFRGWSGLVYRGRPTQEQLVARGLAEYAQHPLFSTVGIDRSYYAPLTAQDLRGLAAQLPPDFRCVMKVWSGICAPVDAKSRAPNPNFLEPGLFQDVVLAPIAEAFRAHQGPLLFQLLPLALRELPKPGDFVRKLSRFFQALPKDFTYAVELRNRELLHPSYFEVLRAFGVAHVFNHWERMPPIREQLQSPGAITSDTVVCRLLLPQGVGYEEAREAYAPFDRLQAVDEAMRDDVVALAHACAETDRTLYVIVNNKAEGCSPLTVRALLERLASAPVR
jgi:uncharacterized protein YecE (DUF72 family)